MYEKFSLCFLQKKDHVNKNYISQALTSRLCPTSIVTDSTRNCPDTGIILPRSYQSPVFLGNVDELAEGLESSEDAPVREGDNPSPSWLIRGIDFDLVCKKYENIAT